MKILYAHLYDASFGMGGAEKVLFDLACVMKKDFAVEIACAVNRGDLQEKFEDMKIPTVSLERSKLKTSSTLRRLERIISEFKPEIIHSHHRYVTFLLDIFFKRKASILHTEHVLRRDKKFLFRYGHFATAVQETVRRNLIDHYKLPAASVVTIPNAIAPLKPDPNKVRELIMQYPRGQGISNVICIGRLEAQKGHRHLIEAVSLMPAPLRSRLRIFLAGRGSLENSLRKDVHKGGLQQNFVFLGYCREVPEFLSLCDFAVLSSLWEGMPLSILEAYRAGRTVIATDIPGSRELIVEGETGLLVPPGDRRALAEKMEGLIRDPLRTQSMGQTAEKFWREHFSFPKLAEAYYRCYERLVKLHGRG